MEACNNENISKKRVRDDSSLDAPESKRGRVDSEKHSPELKPVDSEWNSPEQSRFGDDILDILDDSDTVTDRDPDMPELDSVIKSFEEEILHPPAGSESGESRPELGYLLEASDDELGLPPAISPPDENPNAESINFSAIEAESVGLGNIMRFEDDIPGYDSFVFGIGEQSDGNNDFSGNGDFVTLGGLFDYSESADFSEFSWRPESLPAL